MISLVLRFFLQRTYLADLLRLVDSRVVADGCFRSGDRDFVVIALDIARVKGHVARVEVEP